MADEIRYTMRQTVMEPFRKVTILPSRLGGNAGLTAAADRFVASRACRGGAQRHGRIIAIHGA